MATTKTLPDGKVVTMPAYNENADIAVINTDLSNITDNINTVNTTLGAASSASSVTGADAFSKISTLNSQIITYDFGTLSSLSAFESALNTYGSSLSDNECRNIRVYFNGSASPFAQTRYIGTFRKLASDRYNIAMQENGSNNTITGTKSSSGYYWDAYALNRNINDGLEKKANSSIINLTNGSTVTFTFPNNCGFILQIWRLNSTYANTNGLYIGQAHTNGNVLTIVASESCTVSISGKTLSLTASAENMRAAIYSKYPLE